MRRCRMRGKEFRVSLNLVFFDFRGDPEEKTFWSGTTHHIIYGLRAAGHRVTSLGEVLPRIRRLISGLHWHAYRRLGKRHYIADRHVPVNRLFTKLGGRRLGRVRDADAVLTVSTSCAAYLKTEIPILLLLDATWAQVVELYPYFSAERQAAVTLRGGQTLDRVAFTRKNLHLVMTSAWAANRAIADFGMDPGRVHILPFGANFIEDPPAELVERAISARSEVTCHLLFVGREFERKGGPLAVAIAANLNARGISTQLDIVGCSPAGLPDFVNVHGLLRKDHLEQAAKLNELYASSNFFVMPSRGEAQGIVFNEAAAFGLPVAASDVGGVTSVVTPEVGIALPLEAPATEYADWIASLFLDRSRYLDAARRSRLEFERHLSNRAYTEALERILYAVTGSDNAEPGSSTSLT